MKLNTAQRALADMLLVGNDAKTIARRWNVSDAVVSARLTDLRAALGVDTHSGLMAELRRLQRRPDISAVADCRKNPRQWWTV